MVRWMSDPIKTEMHVQRKGQLRIVAVRRWRRWRHGGQRRQFGGDLHRGVGGAEYEHALPGEIGRPSICSRMKHGATKAVGAIDRGNERRAKGARRRQDGRSGDRLAAFETHDKTALVGRLYRSDARAITDREREMRGIIFKKIGRAHV